MPLLAQHKGLLLAAALLSTALAAPAMAGGLGSGDLLAGMTGDHPDALDGVAAKAKADAAADAGDAAGEAAAKAKASADGALAQARAKATASAGGADAGALANSKTTFSNVDDFHSRTVAKAMVEHEDTSVMEELRTETTDEKSHTNNHAVVQSGDSRVGDFTGIDLYYSDPTQPRAEVHKTTNVDTPAGEAHVDAHGFVDLKDLN
jgi:hypothetical protein